MLSAEPSKCWNMLNVDWTSNCLINMFNVFAAKPRLAFSYSVWCDSVDSVAPNSMNEEINQTHQRLGIIPQCVQMEGANGQVEPPSVALSRARQSSPWATGAGYACAVRVRSTPERARRNLARRGSRFGGEDDPATHARKPPATSHACDSAASAHGGRPAGRPRNAAA